MLDKSSNKSEANFSGPQDRDLAKDLAFALSDDAFWTAYLRGESELHASQKNWSLHVAVFQEPFLGWVLSGRKRVESRFSQNYVAPYGEVLVGDILALKKVGGPIVGVCLVDAVWQYRLDPKGWDEIKLRFGNLICAETDDFWDSRKDARFATLISLDMTRPLPPIPYAKSDRRGWVVERNRTQQWTLNL